MDNIHIFDKDEKPMELNELPVKSIISISRPYVIDIKTLAKGDEYGEVTDPAKKCLDFFMPNDNRVLGEHRFRLVNFGESISSESIEDWVLESGLYFLPPMLYVNDFAKAHPEIQRTIPIVSLGEPEKLFFHYNAHRVLMLSRSGDERSLCTVNRDRDWFDSDWFLLCEKSSGLLAS